MARLNSVVIAVLCVCGLTESLEGSCVGASCIESDEVSVLQVFANYHPGSDRGQTPEVGGSDDVSLQQIYTEEHPFPTLRQQDRAVIDATGGDAQTAQEMQNTLMEVEKAQAQALAAERAAAPMQQRQDQMAQPATSGSSPETTMDKLEALIQEEKAAITIQSENIQNIEAVAPMLQQLSGDQENPVVIQAVATGRVKPQAHGSPIGRPVQIVPIGRPVQIVPKQGDPNATTGQVANLNSAKQVPSDQGEGYVAYNANNKPSATDTWTVDKSVLMSLEAIPPLGALGVPRMYMGCWVTGCLEALCSVLSLGIVGNIWAFTDFVILENSAFNNDTNISSFGMHANFVQGSSINSAKTIGWVAMGMWAVYLVALGFAYKKYYDRYY